MSALGSLIGLIAAVGVLSIGSFVRARRPLAITDRIRPYVVAPSSTRVSPTSPPLLTVVQQLLRSSHRVRSQSTARPTALDRAGWTGTAEQYRVERLAWTAVGALVGAVIGALATMGGGSITGSLVLGCVGGAAGRFLRDQHLAVAARRRVRLIDAQMPAMAELVALAVAAGESVVGAVERVAASTAAPLGAELQWAIAEVRSGNSVESALQAMARRCGSHSVERFVDGLVVALERGTPMSSVLRAQAADARADGLRRLMEGAGRKDALMLVPVVFLVLPTVVAVALFPGIQALRLVVP